MTAFAIIELILDRNVGIEENGRTALYFGMDGDEVIHIRQWFGFNLINNGKSNGSVA